MEIKIASVLPLIKADSMAVFIFLLLAILFKRKSISETRKILEKIVAVSVSCGFYDT